MESKTVKHKFPSGRKDKANYPYRHYKGKQLAFVDLLKVTVRKGVALFGENFAVTGDEVAGKTLAEVMKMPKYAAQAGLASPRSPRLTSLSLSGSISKIALSPARRSAIAPTPPAKIEEDEISQDNSEDNDTSSIQSSQEDEPLPQEVLAVVTKNDSVKKKTMFGWMRNIFKPQKDSKNLVMNWQDIQPNSTSYFEDLLDKRSTDLLRLMVILWQMYDDGPANWLCRRISNSDKYELVLNHNAATESSSFLMLMDGALIAIDSEASREFMEMSAKNFDVWLQELGMDRVSLPENFAKQAYIRLIKMQNALARNRSISAIELLKYVNVKIYDLHVELFHTYTEANDRFKFATPMIQIQSVVQTPFHQAKSAKKFSNEYRKVSNATAELIEGNDTIYSSFNFSECCEEAISRVNFKDHLHNAKLHTLIESLLLRQDFYPTRLNLSHCVIATGALERFLKNQGKNLVYLNLSYCKEKIGSDVSSVKDSLFEVLTDSSPSLKELLIADSNVKTISVRLGSVTHLDLSQMKCNNSIIPSIAVNVPALTSLKLCGTNITKIEYELRTVTELDLSECQITKDTFSSIRENCKRLRILRLTKCASLTEILLSDVSFFAELIVDDCPNLTSIHSGLELKKQRLSGGKSLELRTKLQIVRANRCMKLNDIYIEDASALTTLTAKNCDLSSISLSENRLLPSLRVLELDGNRRLEKLMANPKRLVHFSARECPIKSELTEIFWQYFAQKLQKGDDASEALRLLLAVKPDDGVRWLRERMGGSVFHDKILRNLDVRGANLEGSEFNLTDISYANLSSANLRFCKFYAVNLTGVSLGVKSMLTEHSVPKKSMVIVVAHSPHDEKFVTADVDGRVVLRRGEKILYTFEFKEPVDAAAFSSDGKKLALAGRMLDPNRNDFKAPREVELELQKINPANDKTAITHKDYCLIHVIDIDDSNPDNPRLYKDVFTCGYAHSGDIKSIAFSHDNHYVISGAEDGKIKIRNIETGVLHRVYPMSKGNQATHTQDHVNAIALLSLEKPKKVNIMATGGAKRLDKVKGSAPGSDGTIIIWNIDEDLIIGKPISAHQGPVNCLAFTKNGNWLISGGEDNMVKIWSTKSNWKKVHELICKNRVSCLAISPDDKYVFTGDAYGKEGEHEVRAWEIETGKLLQIFPHDHPIFGIDVDSVAERQGSCIGWVVRTACSDGFVRREIFRVDGYQHNLEHPRKLDLTGVEMRQVYGLSEDMIKVCQQHGMSVIKQIEKPQDEVFEQDDEIVITGPGGYY